MSLDDLLDHVAAAHVLVLLLRGAGLDDDIVARELGLPIEAVSGLAVVARAKVRHALEAGSDLPNDPELRS